MRSVISSASILWVGLICAFSCIADDDTTIAIKRAIVADSAMMHTDFEELATSANTPTAAKVQDKSLTLMLLNLKVGADEKPKEQFRFLTKGSPKASELAEELYRERRTGKRRILLEPVTFIHMDRITDFECNVEGDRATGDSLLPVFAADD